MKQVELVIFDLDGTLIDSKDDIINAVNFALKELGIREKSREEITSYIGTGVLDLIKKSLGEDNNQLFQKAVQIFDKYYEKHSTDNSVLYPNVKEVLEYFKDKKKAIITNKKHRFAVSGLKSLGIYNYFTDIIGGDDITCLKPSACPLDKIIDKFKVKKDKSIIVGDMDIDVVTGKQAGIATCAVTYGIGKKEDIIKAKPDYIIDDITKLKDIIC